MESFLALASASESEGADDTRLSTAYTSRAYDQTGVPYVDMFSFS